LVVALSWADFHNRSMLVFRHATSQYLISLKARMTHSLALPAVLQVGSRDGRERLAVQAGAGGRGRERGVRQASRVSRREPGRRGSCSANLHSVAIYVYRRFEPSPAHPLFFSLSLSLQSSQWKKRAALSLPTDWL
jgi:hypothetical protein